MSRLREIINCAIGECDSSYAETTPSQREGGWVDKKIKNRCRVVPRVCAQALSLSISLSLVGRFGDSSEAAVVVVGVVVVVVVVVVRQ